VQGADGQGGEPYECLKLYFEREGREYQARGKGKSGSPVVTSNPGCPNTTVESHPSHQPVHASHITGRRVSCDCGAVLLPDTEKRQKGAQKAIGGNEDWAEQGETLQESAGKEPAARKKNS